MQQVRSRPELETSFDTLFNYTTRESIFVVCLLLLHFFKYLTIFRHRQHPTSLPLNDAKSRLVVIKLMRTADVYIAEDINVKSCKSTRPIFSRAPAFRLPFNTRPDPQSIKKSNLTF